MSDTIFYSWQSDLPKKTNHDFIQKALEKAAKLVRKDESINVDPVIDRDTRGRPGAPPIDRVIFEKINEAQVFVADVTIINAKSRWTNGKSRWTSGKPKPPRKTPNPNVLVELGYARARLSEDKLLLIQNTSQGGPEELPFDLDRRKVIAYSAEPDDPDLAEKRNQLANRLKDALRTIFAAADPPDAPVEEASPAQQLREAINQANQAQAPRAQRYMARLSAELHKLQQPLRDVEDKNWHEAFTGALLATAPLVLEFHSVAQLASEMDSEPALQSLVAGFGSLMDHSQFGGYGSFHPNYLDFFRYLVHELFVLLVLPLVEYGRWELLSKALEQPLTLEHSNRLFCARSSDGGTFPFWVISQSLETYNSERRAAFIRERFTDGPLSRLDHRLFMETDILLAAAAQIRKDGFEPSKRVKWFPYSALYVETKPPSWLRQAESIKVAERLCPVFGVEDVRSLRGELDSVCPVLSKIYGNHDSYFLFGRARAIMNVATAP